MQEVWTTTVDAYTAEPVGDLGGRVLAAVASGDLRDGDRRPAGLGKALTTAIHERDGRFNRRSDELQRENQAFVDARLLGAAQAHERRIAVHQRRIDTLRERDRSAGVIKMQEGQIKRHTERHLRLEQELKRRADASLRTNDLAICIVEVH